MILCHWTSKSPLSTDTHVDRADLYRSTRYEIDNDAPAWEDAEKQITKSNGGSGTVVSVKSSSGKRKVAPGQTAAEIYEETFGADGKKGSKKSKKSKRNH